jgi:hypothetical protein
MQRRALLAGAAAVAGGPAVGGSSVAARVARVEDTARSRAGRP